MSLTQRFVRADAAGSGDGTTDTNSGANGAFTAAEAITHSASNTGIGYEVKAGIYAGGGTSKTFNGVALTTAPNRWRGFKNTPGDMDDPDVNRGTFASGSEVPAFTFTTGKVTASGAHQIFENIDVRGASSSAGQLTVSGGNCTFRNVRVENTNPTNTAVAADISAAGATFEGSWFRATSAATRILNITAGGGNFLFCVFEGGGNGVDSGAGLVLYFCVFRNVGGHGVRALSGAGTFLVDHCTIYRPGGDGIRLDAVPSIPSIADCILDSIPSGTYGINNASGANTNVVTRRGNVYRGLSGALGAENGFGDSPAFDALTETADRFVNAVGGDFALLTAAVGRNVVIPFPEVATTSYDDKGAVKDRVVTW